MGNLAKGTKVAVIRYGICLTIVKAGPHFVSSQPEIAGKPLTIAGRLYVGDRRLVVAAVWDAEKQSQ